MLIQTALALLLLAAPPSDALKKKAQDLQREATLAMSKADIPTAIKKYEAALKVMPKAYAPDAPEFVSLLNAYAGSLRLVGDYIATQRTYERLLTIHQKTKGEESMQVAMSLTSLGWTHAMRSQWKKADPIFKRALAIYEKLYKDTHPALLATQLDSIAGYYKTANDFPRAEQYHLRAMELRKKVKNVNPHTMLNSYVQMAWLGWMRGDMHQAERWFEKLLGLLNTPPLSEQPKVKGTYLMMIGTVYTHDKDLQTAEKYYGQAERIYDTELAKARLNPGPGGWALSTAVMQSAMFYQQRKHWSKALPLLKESMALQQKKQPANTLAAASGGVSLARAYQELGKLDEARKLLKRLRKAEIKWLGKKRGNTGSILLADLEHQAGRYKQSLKYYTEVAAGYAKTFGPQHPTTAFLVERQASLNWATGRTRVAIRLLAKALAVVERQISLVMHTGNEKDKRNYLSKSAFHLDVAVSLHTRGAPKNQDAALLALQLILQRKGRILDAMADTFSALHKRLSKGDRKLLDELGSARTRLSSLVLKGPQDGQEDDYARQIAELEHRVRKLEATIASRSSQFQAQTLPISVGGVREGLPSDAALVEFISYQAYDPKIRGETALKGRRYAAYVLNKTGDIRFADLGPAITIDAEISRLREALADPDRSDVRGLARSVDDKVMRPVRALLGAAKRVFVAPDGALNVLPFGALVDENDTFLVQTFTFTYLTSGRDLLQLHVQTKSRNKPVVIANPNFGDQGTATPGTNRGLRSFDLRSVQWTALPGTQAEADALSKLIERAEVYVGAEATEERLKMVAGPEVLHIATHGFFLVDQEDPESSGRPAENPLLRSGLVMTGANSLTSDDEDGVLTALEASGLDLWGTQLVVLSACETGLGKVENGEGVYGLRRALVIAGSQSQVMSLWQVDDEATKELMVGFYRRLKQGKGRSASLRESQLRIMGRDEYAHPFYWASFIPSGQWTPLVRQDTK